MAGYIASKGSQILCNTTAVAQVTKIKPPKLHAGSVETTHLLSNWEEFIPTIAGAEEITCTVELDKAVLGDGVNIVNKMSTGTLDTWKIQLGSGTAAIAGTAFVIGFELDEQTVQGVVTADLTIKPTSAWILTT